MDSRFLLCSNMLLYKPLAFPETNVAMLTLEELFQKAVDWLIYILGHRDSFAFQSIFECFARNLVLFSSGFDIRMLLAFKIRNCLGNSFNIVHFITRRSFGA